MEGEKDMLICNKCGGKLVEIVYGEPNEELFEASQRSELVLGGCCIEVDDKGNVVSPEYKCMNCGKEY